jgi:DNA polymerase (family 10)
MTNKDVANQFQYLGKILELYGENQFKIRSYQNAYIRLRKLDQPLSEMSMEEINALPGVGKAIAGKIDELRTEGEMSTLERYKEKTPEGILEMLQIKGFGPKKIKVIWDELGIESIGELLYAVNENRLVELKGFGAKTQIALKEQLEYFQRSKNKFHYARTEASATALVTAASEALPDALISLTGANRRKCNIVDGIELLIATDEPTDAFYALEMLEEIDNGSGAIQLQTNNGIPVLVHICSKKEFGSKLFRYTASEEFMNAFVAKFPGIDFKNIETEQAVFDKAGVPFIEPELRESDWALELAANQQLPQLIESSDVKGVVHAHTTYSDGLHTLREMAAYCKEQGYEYLALTDHSKSAFYANGLQPERVLQQFQEVDALNVELAPFRIFKGIESDILNDGSLDYDDDLLAQFDFIIASVHSNLRMDEEKATNRLIKAVENPYTTILGHPTGRLLLSRQGYPIDYKKVIDACAANNVSIEINANPYRLDLDWRWIPYALEKGILISINPDAHSKQGVHDIHFGTLSARKGGLTKAGCLNAMNLAEFEQYLKK